MKRVTDYVTHPKRTVPMRKTNVHKPLRRSLMKLLKEVPATINRQNLTFIQIHQKWCRFFKKL